MQHHQRNDGGVQARGPSKHGGSRLADGGKLARTSTPGRGRALQNATAVLRPQQNDSEWRRWDQTHGHVLWMGDLQEGWNNATIAGFFQYYGADITVTRKGQDNYCFVKFASTEEAKDFMAKYNHQPLPGKLGDSSRFNIRPRTRPRWYGAEHRSSSTDGSRRDDGGRGRGSGVRDSRGPRLETRNDELIGNKRQRLREVKTERRPHRSHQTHQGRGVGAIRSADRGYYGPGRGNSDRNGHEGRAPRITPASHQRADPEHDFKGRVGHGKHCKVSPGGPLRSRSSSRSRPQVRQRYRSGSPPPSHGSDKRCRSMSSGKGQSRGQTRRRRYDPSLKQVRVPDSGAGGGGGDRGSNWASAFAGTVRNSSKGDGSLVLGQGRSLPQATETPLSPVDRGGMDTYDGVQDSVVATNSGDSDIRVDGRTYRWTDAEPEKVGGERFLSGSAQGAGRRDAEPPTAVSSGEQATLPSQQAEAGFRSSGLNQANTFEEHPGWKDAHPDDDEASGSSRQELGDGDEKDAKAAITTHAWEAAAPVQRDTVHLESTRSDSRCWPDGGAVTSSDQHRHRSPREIDNTTFNGATGKESLSMHEALPSRASPLPASTARSPKFEPLQHGTHQQADTGTWAALPTGSNGQLSDLGGRPNQPEDDLKESSSTESVCDSSNDCNLDDDSKLNDGGADRRLHAEDASSGSCATRTPEGFEPLARDEADERGPNRNIEQNTSPPARRGRKRNSTTDITLAQVIDHHLARRRMNEVASGRERIQVEGNSSCARASFGEHTASADNVGSKNHRHLKGKCPSAGAGSCAAASQGVSLDCSAIVAAAWTNGCVLPLTEVVAPHMRLVAPVLAAEPEGRRVVAHTAAAVAAGAAVLALPDHRLEVTGTCRDGLLLELHPKEEVVRCSNSLDRRDKSAFLSACAGRLQATFDGLVKLDLEFDMVRLPYREAVDTMGSDSSSAELMQWLNEGTATLVRLSAPCAPPRTGGFSFDQAQDLVELREALAHPSGAPFLGIDCSIWPLLPRTGLLAPFSVDIHPVVLPPSEPKRGESSAHQSVIHLAVTVSDPRTFLGSRSGSLGGLLGSSSHSIRVTPGLEVSRARGTTESVGASDEAVVDLLQPDDGRLRCVAPTCTAGGLTWKHVTGLRCVAAVNKLALGSRKELEGKIQLAEGLHTAEIEGLAKRVTALPGVVLVSLAGRQGASADVFASRLCVELTIKGRNPAMLDTGKYLRGGAPRGQVAAEGCPEGPTSNSAPPASHRYLDPVALGRAITTLLGQARSGVGLSGVNTGGSRAAAGEHDIAGLRTAAGGRQLCDIVVVHGCEALDAELLQPGKFGLDPEAAMSVFVDLMPQVCVDNLTPVNGADVRLLRSLLAAHLSYTKASESVALGNYVGEGESGRSCDRSSYFDTQGFLEEWLVAEEREQRLCRSFHPATSVRLNTALPYDLNVLKPVVEPLLRSVPPPTSGSRNSRGGGDGCRSSIYALARSMLRLLRLCEALHVPSVPTTSVLSGLVRSVP